MKSLLAAAALASGIAFAAPATAVTVDPNAGLVDYVFFFNGVGSSAVFNGHDTLEITLTALSTFSIHVEDGFVMVDAWDLVIDGVTVAWDTITGGDGAPNGTAAIGSGGGYFEAIAQLTLGAGTHTIDLTQTAGIPGGSWINISPVTMAPVPLPAGGALLLGGLAGLAALRRQMRA